MQIMRCEGEEGKFSTGILLCVDCTYMCLQEGLGEQTLNHLRKASAHHGQEDAGDEHMIAGLRHASHFAATQHRHAARNVSHGHLVTVLLHLELLELDKLGAACLQIQTTASLVHATIIRGTILHGYEGQRVDGLISLGAAAIACVRGHHHHGLHLGAARHNAAHRDQFANLLRLHLAYGVRLLRGQWLEAHLTGEKEDAHMNSLHPLLLFFTTHNLFISSGGKALRSSRCSIGLRVRASIIRRCSMYTSSASLALTSCCL